jgi:hypothetical protein
LKPYIMREFFDFVLFVFAALAAVSLAAAVGLSRLWEPALP